MQNLKLADKYFVPMRETEKRCTIREGNRAISLGLLLFTGTPSLSLKEFVRVWSVLHTTLRNVPMSKLMNDGFMDYDHALKEMQLYYPDMTLDSEVTVICYRIKGDEFE